MARYWHSTVSHITAKHIWASIDFTLGITWHHWSNGVKTMLAQFSSQYSAKTGPVLKIKSILSLFPILAQCWYSTGIQQVTIDKQRSNNTSSCIDPVHHQRWHSTQNQVNFVPFSNL